MPLRELNKGSVNLAITGNDDLHLLAERGSSRSGVIDDAFEIDNRPGHQKAEAHGCRKQLVQEAKLLRLKLLSRAGETGNVLGWPIEACDKSDLDRVQGGAEDDWDARGQRLGGKRPERVSGCGNHVHLAMNESGCQFRHATAIVLAPAELDHEIPALDEAGFAQALAESGRDIAAARRGIRAQKPHYRRSRLLRPRRQRPCCRPTAEKRDELAASNHSITSSARPSSCAGTSRPRALAALRLITSSNLTGAWTGRSLGFSPLRMRSA